jgi:hypothetical protein
MPDNFKAYPFETLNQINIIYAVLNMIFGQHPKCRAVYFKVLFGISITRQNPGFCSAQTPYGGSQNIVRLFVNFEYKVVKP